MSSAPDNIHPAPTLHSENKAQENNLPSKKAPVSFLDLPRELRDMVYRHSVAAGNLGILRISKLVNEEASQFLSTHAAFRVNLGFVNSTDWAQVDYGPALSAQHVEFRLNTSPDALPFSIDIISGFTGNKIIRESCLVTINYGKEGSATGNIHNLRLYLELYHLRGFKKLVVKIVIERYKVSDFEGLLTEEDFLETFPYDTRLLSHHRKSYENVRSFLEIGLGPAKFDDSVDGHCLEFHPFESVPEVWGPESEGGSH